MGQYFITANLDKKEFINPHRLGDGLKLREQGASQGGTLNAIHALLATGSGRGGGDYIDHPLVGRWGGDRIVVIGDYAERNDLNGVDYAEYIYAACSYTKEDLSGMTEAERKKALGPFKPREWTDISDLARDFLAKQWDLSFGDSGWVTREPGPDSVFGVRTEAAMKPDMIIAIPLPEEGQ